MGNVESVSKNFGLFWQKLTGIFLQKLPRHAAALISVPSFSGKVSAFPSLLQRHESKYTLCPLKNMKNEFFR